MDALLRRLSRTGLRRGLGGEHWAWLLLAGAAYLLRRARRSEAASTTLALEPGHSYLVRLVSAPRRRDRKGTAEEEGTPAEVAALVPGDAPAPPSGT